MAIKIKSHPDDPAQDMELFKNQQENNERIFSEMLRNVRKDVWVLMDLLDKTGINYYVIFQIIRHLNNIALGGKWGEVRIFIENGVVKFVKGEESTKVEESLIIKDPKKDAIDI